MKTISHIKKEIVEKLKKMNNKDVINLYSQLKKKEGVKGKDLFKFVNLIEEKELDLIEEEILKNCEKIESEE